MSDEGKIIAGVAIGLFIGFIVLPRLAAAARARQTPTGEKQTPPAAVNCETWEWTDWKGRPRTITVHREVR